MMKRIVYFLLMFTLCAGLVQTECCAEQFDIDRECSLELLYSNDGKPFSDLPIEIYRVAEFYADGTYALIKPFSDYPISIHHVDSQKKWRESAETAKNYAVSNQVQPTQVQLTDQNGKVLFTGLKTGIYLVKGVLAQDAEGTYQFHDFMIFLPAVSGNQYLYDIQAKPKFTQYTAPQKYTVIKLWDDVNSEADRPAQVEVDLLRDGIVIENITLKQDNSWSYSWEVSADDRGSWTVLEKNVPEGYYVSVECNKTTFIITNSKIPDVLIPEAPNTGDTTPLLLYVILMCLSGIGLVVLACAKLKD